MVLNDLMITLASDGLAKGSQPPKATKPKRPNKAAKAPLKSTQGNARASTTGQADEASHGEVVSSGEIRRSALFDWSDEEEAADDQLNQPPTPATNEEVIPTTEDFRDNVEATKAADEAVFLDPLNSPRQYWREPFTGIQREIWRPGDGDGDPNADYFEKPGARAPLEKRWRLYQSKTGDGPLDLKTNMPPKFVVLDDRAAYEALTSTIPRATLVRFWSYDFAGQGKIRARRPHRGRGAVSNYGAEGDGRYHYAQVGNKSERYFFTGEKDYTPIVYQSLAPPPASETADAASKKRKAKSSSPDEPVDLRKHGHNQYTPKEELVRYGAKSLAKGRQRYRPRINAFLRRSASPPWSMDRSKLYGGVGEQARAFTSSYWVSGHADTERVAQEEPEPGSDASGGLFVDEDDNYAQGEEEEDTAQGQMAPDPAAKASAERTRSIELSDRASSSTSPAPTEAVDAFVKHRGHGSPTGRTGKSRRKAAQPMGFMERMAAGGGDEDGLPYSTSQPVTKPSVDSGSYAWQLEQQLYEANETIEKLTDELEEAQARISDLEYQILVKQ